MTSGFSGKVALVTGGGSGIGAAVCRRLASNGAQVVVADIDSEAAREVATAIRESGGEARDVAVDVTDAEAVERLVEFAVSDCGGLHLAVNNAGFHGSLAMTADYPLDNWRKLIDVNLNSVFYSMKYEINAMLAAGGGAIVNMASVLGCVGLPATAAYTACASMPSRPAGSRRRSCRSMPSSPPTSGWRRCSRWVVAARRKRWQPSSASSSPTRRASSPVAAISWTAPTPPIDRGIAPAGCCPGGLSRL